MKKLMLKVLFVCDWGRYAGKYDAIHYAGGRPIHPQLGGVPQWANRKNHHEGRLV